MFILNVVMRSLLFLVMSVSVVEGSPPGVMELYNIAQGFLKTLHDILEEGAAVIDDYDEEASEIVEMFEYNWLSIFGINKGIFPLISDFYFNYYKNKEFEDRNGHFVITLGKLLQLFTRNGSEEQIHAQLKELVSVSLKANLFKEGVILEFMKDFDVIVKNKRDCIVLIRIAKSKSEDITKLLHFLMKGAPSKGKESRNSEL